MSMVTRIWGMLAYCAFNVQDMYDVISKHDRNSLENGSSGATSSLVVVVVVLDKNHVGGTVSGRRRSRLFVRVMIRCNLNVH